MNNQRTSKLMIQENGYSSNVTSNVTSRVSLSEVKAKGKFGNDPNSSPPKTRNFRTLKPGATTGHPTPSKKRCRNDQHFTSYLNSNNLIGIGRSHISDILTEMNHTIPRAQNNTTLDQYQDSEGLAHNESYCSLGMTLPVQIQQTGVVNRPTLKFDEHEIEDLIGKGP